MSVVVVRGNERHSQTDSIQQSVKKRSEEAYKLINEALTADESGDKQAAISAYEKALQKLSNAISACKSSESLNEMKRKMEKSHSQVSERLKELTVKAKPPRPPNPPATATVSSTKKGVAKGSGTTCTNTQQHNKQQVDTQAELLYQISEGVGLFQVNSRGNIVKFKDVDGLNVFCFKEKIKGNPPAFIQCGEWVFPLVPGKSPVLKAANTTYMFPELQGDDGCSVGLMLEGASEDTVKRLDMILSSLAMLKESSDVEEVVATAQTTTLQPVERIATKETTKDSTTTTTVSRKEDTLPQGWGATVAAGISTGVDVVSRTVEKGTELANKAIVMGANKLREKMKPSEEEAEIPESVQKGVVVADQVTGVVVGVSELLLMSLAKMTVQVGKAVGQAVGDTKVVDTYNVNPDLMEAWKVTKAGVSGVAKVFSLLEQNSAILLKTSADQTTRTVTHKYGNQAGEVTGHSLHTAANVTGLVMTYGSWKKLGISFLSKVGNVLKKQSEETTDKTIKTE